jgi:AraC-like DNA-binding protein/ligand-binding sensor protein
MMRKNPPTRKSGEAESLLLELFEMYERSSPLKINFDDSSGVARDVPMLHLPLSYQMHGCRFCLHAKSTAQGNYDCMMNKYAANRIAIRTMAGFQGQCHLGLTDIIEPLVFHQRVLGIFFYGSVVVAGTEKKARERILKYCRRRGLSPRGYLRELQRVPRITRDELKQRMKQLKYTARLAAALLESWGLPEERYRTEMIGAAWNKQRDLPPLVRYAILHIQHHYAEPLLIADMARKLRCHPDYLSRIFKKHLKCNLGDYVQQVRVDHARQMLLADRFSVSEVGYEVGFQDKSHFGRIFRKLAGMTPGEYRDRHGCKPKTANPP